MLNGHDWSNRISRILCWGTTKHNCNQGSQFFSFALELPDTDYLNAELNDSEP